MLLKRKDSIKQKNIGKWMGEKSLSGLNSPSNSGNMSNLMGCKKLVRLRLSIH